MSDVRTPRRTLTRLSAGAQAAWGACLAVLPRRTARLVGVGRSEPPAWIVRILGGRLVVQHGWVLLGPTRVRVLTGVVVDLLHAASMAAVVALWPAYRRPAAVSGVLAAGSALLGGLTAPEADR